VRVAACSHRYGRQWRTPWRAESELAALIHDQFSAAGQISSGSSTASAARASPADARLAMFAIPTLSSCRPGPGDGSHLLVRAHTIACDWSRSSNNGSIEAADADLSAAAKLATHSALGACYVSDDAERTIAAIAGDIQDRA